MHRADIDDNSQVGLTDGCQISDFPEMVHTHLQHRNLCILRHLKNRHGHADIIVVVCRGLAHLIGATEHRRHHFLGGAFAHRTGDTNYLHTDAFPLTPGNFAQSQAGILYHDGGKIPIAVGAKHRRCALLQGSGDKIVTVTLPL